VFVDQAAEQVGAVELQIGSRSRRRWVSVCLLGRAKCECPMRPMLVVMARVDMKHVLELAAAENEQPVEALATHRPDPTLGMCVRVRCLDGCADHSHSVACEDLIEATAELGVAIVDQETERLLAILERHQQVACLLGSKRISSSFEGSDLPNSTIS
jgi:hypothetical protein